MSYRNLTVGFQKDVRKIFGNNHGEEYEYSASAYGRMLGGDFAYSTSNNYTLTNQKDKNWKQEVDCFRSKRLQANGYYVFNHRRFSYPAAFTQSYRQKRSAGSALLSLSVDYEWLEMSPEQFPTEIKESLKATEYIHKLTYKSFNIGAGYAYNWVINRHWMLHGTAIPSFSLFRKARMEYEHRSEKLDVDKVNWGAVLRLGVLWDNARRFGGFTAVMNLNSLSRQPLEISTFHVRTRVFYGFRF